MATPVTAYKSDDGKVFATMEEAQRHDLHLQLRQKISEFINSPANNMHLKASDEELSEFISRWERYRRANP